MAYMYVCPECRSFFKVKSKDRDVKCPKCSHQYLLDLKMDEEAWGTLTLDERKIIIKARVSEEGLQDVVASGSPKPGMKAVKKKVVRKVVKRVVKKPEAALNAEEPATDQKYDTPEEALKEAVKNEEPADSPTGQNWEDVFAAEERQEAKEEEIKEENKASSGAAGILASFIKGDKAGKEEADAESSPENKEAAKDTEERKVSSKKEKPKLNKKYVAIVAGTIGALLLYLSTVTFIIPVFRIRSELPTLRSAVPGDTVHFGKYRGQNEWVVLDKKGTRLLCISDYPIYGQEYYDEDWEESSLRKWFNSVFINSSFNVFERHRITSTKDIMKEDADYVRDVGADLPDKVFIISDRELDDYLHQYRDAMIRVNDDDIRAVCWIETK